MSNQKDPHQIIIRPLITEKSSDQGVLNKYFFQVAKDANKIEIAEAIKAIYAKDNPQIKAVNTINVKGKKKRAMVRGGKSEVLAGAARSRNVVIEFKDYDTALACYRSPEYQHAIAERGKSAELDVLVIEGYDGPQPADG
jgi:ribosomal protein L23